MSVKSHVAGADQRDAESLFDCSALGSYPCRSRMGHALFAGYALQLPFFTRETRKRALKTYSPSAKDIQREWHLIDADSAILGRLASEVAVLLRGKHKASYAPHIDTGDHVVVINASKIAVTAGKVAQKRYYRHTGYPGSLRERSLAQVLEADPTEAVVAAVRGMLPKTRLGRQMIKKLHVYADAEHNNGAQAPKPYELDARARAKTEEGD